MKVDPKPVYSVWNDREIINRVIFLDRERRDGREIDMEDRHRVGKEMSARDLW